jgi:hypothetical protein
MRIFVKFRNPAPVRRGISLLTLLVAFASFGFAPLFAKQAPAMKMPAAGLGDHNKSSLDVEMTDHQNEMQALTTRLGESFQAIANARDAKGYVHDRAMLKAHEADIKALRNAVRDHKLFLSEYEHTCGVNSKQEDAMIQHQQEMKGMLYDVVETFDTYEYTNDAPDNSYSTPVEEIGLAFDGHRAALKELTGAIAQHKQAMQQMMKKCM